MPRFDRAANADRLGDIEARNAAVKEARGLGIATPGLRELRREFRDMDKAFDRQLAKDLKAAVEPTRRMAAALAPRRSGDLERSIKTSVTRRGVAIRSKLPYANVIHWGGSVGKGHQPNNPWSGRTFVHPSLFISRALEAHENQLVDAIGDVVEDAAVQLGWHRGNI